METNNLNAAAAMATHQMKDEKKTKGLSNMLALQDADAGYKIKDTADNIGIIGSIGALILGCLAWGRADDLMGFLIGLALVGIGMAASFVIMSLLYSYADMVNVSFEQSEILKRLEANKAEEMLKTQAEQQRAAERADTAEQNTETDLNLTERENNKQNENESEFNADDSNPAVMQKSKPDKPLDAVEVDRMRRIAHFSERSDLRIRCPICGKLQTADTDVCFYCSCQFVFSDEQPD